MTVSDNLMTRAEVGARLRTERRRLGLSQADFAQLATVSRRTQASYEAGDGAPGADYLSALAHVGVDVLYVVTGRLEAGEAVAPEPKSWLDRADGSLSADESQLLSSFRQMAAADRSALQAIAGSLARRVENGGQDGSSKSLAGPA
jgi:transcriptional regulator with XRE-family HTH domain